MTRRINCLSMSIKFVFQLLHLAYFIINIQQYLDGDGGNSGDCKDLNSAYLQAFQRFETSLYAAGKRALLTGFGGSGIKTCITSLQDMLVFLKKYKRTFVGWAAWGAGLDTSSPLYLNPNNSNINQTTMPINIVRDVLHPHMSMAARSLVVDRYAASAVIMTMGLVFLASL